MPPSTPISGSPPYNYAACIANLTIGRFFGQILPYRHGQWPTVNNPALGQSSAEYTNMLSTYQLRASVIALGIFVQAGIAAGPAVKPSDLTAARLAEYWVANIPLAEGDILQDIHLIDGTLYAISGNGTVYSVEAHTGLIRWAERLGRTDVHIPAPTHYESLRGDGPAIFRVGDEIIMLDRYTGKVIYRFRPDAPLSAMPVAGGGRLFIAGMDERLRALGAPSTRTCKLAELWQVSSRGVINTKPVLYGNGKLLFATQSGKVFSCYAADRTADWGYAIPGAIIADLTVESDGVYIASTDRSLYKLDPAGGHLLWRVRLPKALRESPLVAGDYVYQRAGDHGVVAFDAAVGKELWRVASGTTVTARLKDHDLIFASDGHLLSVTRETGQVAHTMVASGVDIAATNVSSDASYLATWDGAVTCIRPIDVPYLKPSEVNLARSLMNRSPAQGPLTKNNPAGTDASQNAKRPRVDPLKSRNDRP